jgi:hypothetical protein
MHCDLVRGERVVMQLDARLGTPPAAGGDLDQGPVGAADSDVVGGRSVTQRRGCPRGEDCGHPSAFACQGWGTEGVHGSMHIVEESTFKAVSDRVPSDT